MGMWLPNGEQVAFFSANIDTTKDVLANKLNDQNSDVRQRAAYIIEEIGPAAKPMQTALVTALAKEKVPLVRIYLCNALRAIGEADEEALAKLRELFHTSGDDKDTLEQRIYSGAGSSTLSKNPKEVSECTNFVCRWLKSPSKDLDPIELEKYWDLRWSTVNAVEHMTHAQQAIPLLESMLSEPEKRSWVNEHVPRALVALKGGPVAETNQQPAGKTKWKPPAKPDPQQILNEAQADTMAGRYDEALAKHVWFHRNALKIDPAFYGVRLSFALSYWKELGIVYPPAKAKLIEIRDEAGGKATSGENIRESFHEFQSINSTLGDDKRTVALFSSLDKDYPKAAGKVFDVARPALIKAGEIKLCSKYLDAKTEYPRLVEMYRQMMSLRADPQFGERHTEFAQQRFSNEVATLVALLVLSERKDEAEVIAANAKIVWADTAFADTLEKALTGQVPEP